MSSRVRGSPVLFSPVLFLEHKRKLQSLSLSVKPKHTQKVEDQQLPKGLELIARPLLRHPTGSLSSSKYSHDSEASFLAILHCEGHLARFDLIFLEPSMWCWQKGVTLVVLISPFPSDLSRLTLLLLSEVETWQTFNEERLQSKVSNFRGRSPELVPEPLFACKYHTKPPKKGFRNKFRTPSRKSS